MSDSFDYIIIGAGSAGCVLAAELSADPLARVLLLEAGGSDRRFWIRAPLGYAKTYADPRVNWCFTAAPDPGLGGRAGYWPRGKVLGGSGSINAMAYMRGLPHDFDDWAAAGATGWGWEDVRPVYEAMERRDPPGATGDGPVRVSDLRAGMHPFSDRFLAMARDLGWPLTEDPSRLTGPGIGAMRSTVRDGRRWSPVDAFLRPAMRRQNLRIVTGAHVTRIRLDGRRAVGVDYMAGGAAVSANAAREVILSAGAIGSPQILMLSGIGPADHLKSRGIAVAADLPQVGQGLQDHLAISHYYHANERTLNDRLGTWLGQMQVGARYVLRRDGPMSVPVNQISGYVHSSPEAPVPDLQIYCNPMSYVTRPDGSTGVDPVSGFLLCAQPSRPESRGSVSLASADPQAAPVIQPNSLSTEGDRRTAIAACRAVRAMAETGAMRGVTRRRLDPDVTAMDDAAMLENFRARAGTVFHPSCTCRMGAGPASSVTDPNLRVHGIARLRVVDASAFPNVTSGNTNAPVMMLALRAAELIRKG